MPLHQRRPRRGATSVDFGERGGMVAWRQEAVAQHSGTHPGAHRSIDPARSGDAILMRLRSEGQRSPAVPHNPAHEYDFLMRTLIDRATLRRAHSFAAEWRVPVPEVLISLGWVEESDYVRTL